MEKSTQYIKILINPETGSTITKINGLKSHEVLGLLEQCLLIQKGGFIQEFNKEHKQNGK